MRFQILASLLLTITTIGLETVPRALSQPTGTDFFGDRLPPDATARLGTVRWRNGSAISFLAYINGGKEFLTVGTGKQGSIRIWDVASGKEIRAFGVGAGGFLTADRKILINSEEGVRKSWQSAVMNADGLWHVWDIASGKELRSFRLDPGPPVNNSQTIMSPDGRFVVIKNPDHTIRIHNTENGKLVRQFG